MYRRNASYPLQWLTLRSPSLARVDCTIVAFAAFRRRSVEGNAAPGTFAGTATALGSEKKQPAQMVSAFAAGGGFGSGTTAATTAGC